MTRLRAALAQEVDPASIAVFRMMFGILAAATALRFVLKGWIQILLVEPEFHFAWIDFIEVPSSRILYVLFGLQFVAGVLIACGVRVRFALFLWLVSFGYVELLDKSLYLNHYVLFSLVGLTLFLSPAARLRLSSNSRGAPQWLLWILRVEFSMVFFWAGVHKINPDWLLRAEPLTTWLQAHSEFPVVGPVLAWDSTAVVMSWSGMIYDLGIPLLLLWPRTRMWGLVLVVSFHSMVGLLFPIGVFPFLMMAGALLFCSPQWPRRFLSSRWKGSAEAPRAMRFSGFGLWGVAVLFLTLFPARSLLGDGNVSWTENAYRFSWKVLLNEKTGLVNYRVVDPESQRTWIVSPADELTLNQHQQMRTQPDMIRDYALHLQSTKQKALNRPVEVYVDAWASLNGRPSQRLIRSDVDLTQSKSTLKRMNWIVPLAPLSD